MHIPHTSQPERKIQPRVSHSFDPHLGRRITREIRRGPVDAASLLHTGLAQIVSLEIRIRSLRSIADGSTATQSRPLRRLARELSSLSERFSARLAALEGRSATASVAERTAPQIGRTTTTKLVAPSQHIAAARATLLSELDREYGATKSSIRQSFDHFVAQGSQGCIELTFSAMELLDLHRKLLRAMT